MTLAYEDSVVMSYPVRSRASTGHRPFATPIAASPPSSTERSCIDATPIPSPGDASLEVSRLNRALASIHSDSH